MLGVLLCYNDGDLLTEALEHLLQTGHDVIVWNHGSTDNTADILGRYRPHLMETRLLERSFDFYKLYPEMSRHLLERYVSQYDWISWPDQDEFLEGQDRSKTYRDWVEVVHGMGYDWVRFVNFNFWVTAADDPNESLTLKRVRHYAPFLNCAPRLRAWRASATNERWFNHNKPHGQQWPFPFKLRHYPMRTMEQLNRRLFRDRAGIRRGGNNYHYENMARWPSRLVIAPEQLHYDDGRSELDSTPAFDWRSIYGWADTAEREPGRGQGPVSAPGDSGPAQLQARDPEPDLP
jgi:glycosyltransferase involved in cell wall biosynthesis